MILQNRISAEGSRFISAGGAKSRNTELQGAVRLTLVPGRNLLSGKRPVGQGRMVGSYV